MAEIAESCQHDSQFGQADTSPNLSRLETSKPVRHRLHSVKACP